MWTLRRELDLAVSISAIVKHREDKADIQHKVTLGVGHEVGSPVRHDDKYSRSLEVFPWASLV